MDLQQKQPDVELWSCSIWRSRSLRRSFRLWMRKWNMPSHDEGERRRRRWLTIPVAHTRLACCGSNMCTWPRRHLREKYLLMLNSV